MEELFLYKCKTIRDLDLIKAMKELGIEKDDDICIHRELYKIGKPLLEKNKLCERISNLFLDICLKGTILMPTFTYSFCKNEIYNVQESFSTMGILSEHFRHKKGVMRTKCPIFSFAVFWTNARDYLDISNEVLGKNSVYEKLIQHRGKIVLFGNWYKGYTFFHYLETLLGVSYRYPKIFRGIVSNFGSKYSHEVVYSVRDLEVSSEIDYMRLANFLKESQCLKILPFGGGEIGVIDLVEAKAAINDKISNNEKYFVLST